MTDALRPPLHPAVAEVRLAVRVALQGLLAGEHIVRGHHHDEGDERPVTAVHVALSGGPDSLALAAAVAFEAPKLGLTAGAIVVDHALQSGSEAVAERAAEQARGLGLDPVSVVRVEVGSEGGPEAAARDARYAAIAALAGGEPVLLGHTLDDQAETVLLGLGRGSGGRSLSGMAPFSGDLVRPLLGVRRATTHAACAAEQLEPWTDPHNVDPAYLRVRVREEALPLLEDVLGPGVAEALARTADQLREDERAFAGMIDEIIEDVCEPSEAGIAVSSRALAANPPALRQRIIRHVLASEFGLSASRSQTLEVARLVTDWRGQGPIDLPGVRVRRDGLLVRFEASATASATTSAEASATATAPADASAHPTTLEPSATSPDASPQPSTGTDPTSPTA